MRIAFLSDIHGNAIALEAVLQDIERKKVDRIIVLGDLAYRGPEPAKCIQWIRSLQTDVIKGNADQWIVRGVRSGEVPDQALATMQTEQAWARDQLSEEEISYLDNLPTELSLSVENIKIHAFHATPNSLFDVITPDGSDHDLLESLTLNEEADLYLYGHIHRSYQRTIAGKTIVNLGSVGLPFDGIPKASYVLLDIENNQLNVQQIRVSYPIETVCKQYEDVHYPNATFMQKIIQTAQNG
ncbi:metallophosphoesterase family protein [Gracilibacillus alcaliphilus]|uniref:metallophosphoesterase family protein n=1 Tax=Gracilibacillus alcaliphilus TaxID=1401441 RepID=UPI00195D0840|nr:metallophosphoesterase family protein [Gracilibacillus alcaliphilus]MBM7676370.1 putative phosphoesterase [Gracilibacillus alcaliphilus]